MSITDNAKEYYEKFYSESGLDLQENDGDFAQFFFNFAFDEVVNNDDLDDETRFMAILSALIGCQGIDMFCITLKSAIKAGVKPVEIKEIVYQAVAYLGAGRVYPYFNAVNEVFAESGIKLPLESQSVTNPDTRLEAGIQTQVDIFGEHMRDFWKSGDSDTVHINRWLAGNCFGDYYTRNGLDYKKREMITFCFIAAQGGCEPQLTSHAAANMKIGNDKNFLIKIVSQCLPYIGYPRSLNAIRCINNAAGQN